MRWCAWRKYIIWNPRLLHLSRSQNRERRPLPIPHYTILHHIRNRRRPPLFMVHLLVTEWVPIWNKAALHHFDICILFDRNSFNLFIWLFDFIRWQLELLNQLNWSNYVIFSIHCFLNWGILFFRLALFNELLLYFFWFLNQLLTFWFKIGSVLLDGHALVLALLSLSFLTFAIDYLVNIGVNAFDNGLKVFA